MIKVNDTPNISGQMNENNSAVKSEFYYANNQGTNVKKEFK